MQVNDKKIIDAIIVELNHFKFSRSSVSYQYLIEAVYLVVKSPTSIKNFNHNVYEPIVRRYLTRFENVKWCLNKLIDLMYANTPPEVIYDYFNFFMDEKPTLKYFIITVARNVYDSQSTVS